MFFFYKIYHFIFKYTHNFRLKPAVRQKMIRLLVIDQDAQRYERVPQDTFCGLARKIQSGESDVACANPINADRIILRR